MFDYNNGTLYILILLLLFNFTGDEGINNNQSLLLILISFGILLCNQSTCNHSLCNNR